MVEKNVTIVNKTGLHARPANGLVNLVKKYASRISLIKENKTANAKSIINVLTLDLNQGARCWSALTARTKKRLSRRLSRIWLN